MGGGIRLKECCTMRKNIKITLLVKLIIHTCLFDLQSDAEGQSSAEGDRVANQGDSVGDKSEDNPQIFKEVTTKKGLKWIDLRIGEGPQRPTKGRAVKIYCASECHQ